MSSRARYRDALADVLDLVERAYLATSEPAPHPVRWKRWLRRPYRKGDPAAYMAELHRLASESPGVKRARRFASDRPAGHRTP